VSMWLILFHCHILGLKFFYTLSFQKCSVAFYLSSLMSKFLMNMLTFCLLLCSLVSVLVYASVKEPTIIETIRLNRLHWFGHVQRMEENVIPKRVLYMTLGTTRLSGRPRNRWQDEVRQDGRIVDGEGW